MVFHDIYQVFCDLYLIKNNGRTFIVPFSQTRKRVVTSDIIINVVNRYSNVQNCYIAHSLTHRHIEYPINCYKDMPTPVPKFYYRPRKIIYFYHFECPRKIVSFQIKLFRIFYPFFLLPSYFIHFSPSRAILIYY